MALRIFEPSGFVSRKPIQPLKPITADMDRWVEGDIHATNYHTQVGASGVVSMSPKDIINLLKHTVSLFGSLSLHDFFYLNFTRNEFYSDLHYEFLKDTVDFIKTGKRSMRIHTWMQMLSVPKKKISKKYVGNTTYTMKSDYYRNLTIQQWIGQDDGFVDLIYSLYIIFGKYTA